MTTSRQDEAQLPEGQPQEEDESVIVHVQRKRKTGASSNRLPPELFDEAFYRARYGDSLTPDADLLDDYLENGWKLGWDPSPQFSTSYYLEQNKDVAEAGFNPLVHYVLHGKAEGRRPAPFTSRRKDYSYRPLISVIIPVFNHAAFLPQRLESILTQNYENMEIIVLDDASTDGSAAVAERILSEQDIPYQVIRNDRNSGSIFGQWEKGVRLANGDIVWLCESDDYCERNFLRELIPLLVDESIMLAFGDIQFCDEAGELVQGLDHYRHAAEPDIWNATLVRPAAEWFGKAFAHANVIPNVGGCLFRNQKLADEEWAKLRTYSVVGDWYFYLTVARGGRIAYEPAARAYFRQHNTNSSVKSFRAEKYYREHEDIATAIASRWGLSRSSVDILEQNVHAQYERFFPKERATFAELFSADRICATPRTQTHVLMCTLGFQLGGGELFPIHLANMLVRSGTNVSMLLLMSEGAESRIRDQLDRRVAVYDVGILEEMHTDAFLAGLKADIVHSHNVGGDIKFFGQKDSNFDIPYVATLHGSYEFATLADETIYRILKGVKRWIYLTERNLDHIKPIRLDPKILIKLPNALDVSGEGLPFGRKDLGISDNALVFSVISRAIKEKSWEQAAIAFRQALQGTKREMHLLFCGTGPEADRLKDEFSSDNIHFLGFQSNPHGIYRMSSCALLPSRFGGESYPLTLIEALQVGRPAICTDLGECRAMITAPGGQAGILIEPSSDDEEFVAALSGAILEIGDEDRYAAAKRQAEALSTAFDPQNMVASYRQIYAEVLRECAGYSSA